ncbi:MAG TPA: hypothetical protein PKD86_17515 [Gemmatales bacterium]|mgnify:CR=1 FL=1|nr:hypothetical protein [Gemmatales bacterium]HMP61145.1 hypothetical protein [Gemmatales bacterium]
MLEILLAVVPCLWLAIVAHELGHALLFTWCGHAVTSFGSGLGRPVLVVPLGRSRFFLGLQHPFQGLTLSLTPPRFSRWRRALPLAGGILANTALALVAWWLLDAWPERGHTWHALLWVNGLLAVGNAIPFRVRLGDSHHVVESDGLKLWVTLLGRVRIESLQETLQVAAAMTPLLEAIGDHVLLTLARLRSAHAWLALGNTQVAREQVQAAALLQPRHWPFTAAIADLLRATALAQLESPEQAAEHLAEVERQLDQLAGNSADRLQLGILRAELWQRQGRHREAAELIENLFSEPTVASLPGVELLATANRASAWADADERERAEAALAQMPEPGEPLLKFIANRDVARAWVRAGQPERAARYFEAAVAAGRQLYDQFIDPRVREQLREGLREFEEEALAVGLRPPEADGRFFAASTERETVLNDQQSRRDRWWGRVGIGVHLFNAGLAISLALAFVDYQALPEAYREKGSLGAALVASYRGTLGGQAFLVLMFILILGLGTLFGLVELALCWLRDRHGTARHRLRPGRRLLLNGIWPWFILLVAGGLVLGRLVV